MAKTIRGLPDPLKRASIRFAEDSDSSDPAAKARVAELRDRMETDDFFVMEKASQGMGPREMQKRWGGAHENWSKQIRDALGEAAEFYGLQAPKADVAISIDDPMHRAHLDFIFRLANR